MFGVPRTITDVVWHSTEGYSVQDAIDTWNTGKQAGAHLVVDHDGEITLAVKLEDVAWHAGTSPSTGRTAFWRDNNINPCSVGVELVGFASTGFTGRQGEACSSISDYFRDECGVPQVRAMDCFGGHHAHADISSQRSDPGPHFDWAWVAA